MRLLALWLINALALLALPYLLPSIRIAGFGTALWVAVLLGLVNAVMRPLLILLTLPLTLLTLGLFILVINGLLFFMVAQFVDGFVVEGVWSGVLGAILYSLVSWLLTRLLLGSSK